MEDHSIAWMRKRLWLVPEMFCGVDVALGQAGETAGVTPVEITNVGMNSWLMGTDGELINGCIICPYDLDPDKPIGYRIVYTIDHDGTGSATTHWILLTGTEVRGAAISVPATALDTLIGVDTYKDTAGDATTVVDFLLQISPRGIDNILGLTRKQIEEGALITWSLEQNAAVNDTDVHLLGIWMDYAVMRTVGTGSHIDQPLQSDGQA